jgi:hypothetical protein
VTEPGVAPSFPGCGKKVMWEEAMLKDHLVGTSDGRSMLLFCPSLSTSGTKFSKDGKFSFRENFQNPKKSIVLSNLERCEG